ncbi:histidine kinase [Gloeocapsa sp. PCC 73106]|uniref:histidine kinase n=1 Tax=Gloeocapsa sp. PCC 73106 TaxID=102232 RepID=UPI0002AC3B14|nr:histidine kinase [Gloeocapsa sp. PCC 73106]ELR99852.1 histidine kinase,KaiB domain-containing protein,histidine kinase [Gloeocapsa sp. PCC 73106]
MPESHHNLGESAPPSIVRTPLQLLLFVDERPRSQDNIQRVQKYLESLSNDYPFELEIIDIAKQPQLVEHFRILATPALVKIFPEPKHTLAGSDLVLQLKKWWDHWKPSKQEQIKDEKEDSEPDKVNWNYSRELMELTDQVFCLKKEKEELLEQLRFKDQILAMLAHDLRSPLTAASIAIETLELAQNYGNNERNLVLKENLNKQVKQQFQIMNRMITDLLQASKSMGSRLRVQPQEMCIKSLSEEVLHHFAPRFRQKSLQLKQDIPQDIPLAYADRELIRQVIVNLLDNAVKYTEEGGMISYFVIHRTTQKIQVSVADTGPGIPEEKREHIFEGHFRLKRDEAKEGYGLGLYLCRKIIRAHYGNIWVDSIPHQGSCFHLTLPVYC